MIVAAFGMLPLHPASVWAQSEGTDATTASQVCSYVDYSVVTKVQKGIVNDSAIERYEKQFLSRVLARLGLSKSNESKSVGNAQVQIHFWFDGRLTNIRDILKSPLSVLKEESASQRHSLSSPWLEIVELKSCKLTIDVSWELSRLLWDHASLDSTSVATFSDKKIMDEQRDDYIYRLREIFTTSKTCDGSTIATCPETSGFPRHIRWLLKKSEALKRATDFGKFYPKLFTNVRILTENSFETQGTLSLQLLDQFLKADKLAMEKKVKSLDDIEFDRSKYMQFNSLLYLRQKNRG